MPHYKEIQAKTLLRKQKYTDSWFISSCGMNIYRGCEHNCIYCDGRNEKYQVEGEFGHDICVKINAVDLLKKEIALSPRKKPLPPGFICVGGGVGDLYQQAEERYKLSTPILSVLHENKKPIHILTKSNRVLKDLSILKLINEDQRAIVSFSLSSSNDTLTQFLEPGASSASERLEALRALKKAGIDSGIFLMPIIPYITDTEEVLKKTLSDIKDAGANYIVFGGMTMKEGRQKNFFMHNINMLYPALSEKYTKIYTNDRYGSPAPFYYNQLQTRFNALTKDIGIPKRIPASIFSNILDRKSTLAVILDQLDYLSNCIGRKTRYGYIAHQIFTSDYSVEDKKFIESLKGTDSVTERILREIIDTGTAQFYELLVRS